MGDVAKKRSRWRWVWRGLAIFAVVVVVGVAVPFVFTRAVVLWAVGRTEYARYEPEIGGASLSAKGELVLRDVVLHEVGSGGMPWMRAGEIRVDFSWWEVFGGKTGRARGEDVTLYVRAAGAAALPMGGGGGAGGNPMPAGGGGAGVGNPFWCDLAECRGKIELGADRILPVAKTLTFEVRYQMHGPRGTPTREVEVGVDGGSEGGRMHAALVIEPVGAGERIRVSELTMRELRGTINEELAKSMLAKLPGTFQQALRATISEVQASGVIEDQPGGMAVRGTVAVRGLGVSSEAGAKAAVEVTGLAMSGAFDGPVEADFIKTMSVREGKMAVGSLAFGGFKVGAVSTDLTIVGGLLEAADVKAEFGGGEFAGDVKYSVAEGRLVGARLSVKHLDQKQVAENLSPDRLYAEGKVSGTIELTGGEGGSLEGTIDLTSDGPGRLKIKDEKTAQALAEKLETGAAPGVLPANFGSIVVGQLKDYPYDKGHIRVSAPAGEPVVTLNYVRPAVKEGEPGYGVKTTMAGQAVVVSYTVQLPDLSLVLKGKTIGDLLALAAGLGQIAGYRPGG